MSTYSIDSRDLALRRERASLRAARGEGSELAAALRSGSQLEADDLVTLFLSEDIPTKDLLDLAAERRSPGASTLETFSPLYISNECDGECVMCGMRRFNRELRRTTADESTVRDQIEILYGRGLRGIAILSGEYRHGPRRDDMLARTASAARMAMERGFTHVLINVGSLDRVELEALVDGMPPLDNGPLVTMCTFQETYDPTLYGRFMGTSDGNPRSGFERRLGNFDRAADAGFRAANPGLLLGLNRDLGYELLALAAHARHLLARGMLVYISLPRLRKASGAPRRAGVSDDELTRIVSLLSAGLSEAKVVISTRESPAIQRRLVPVIGVLTAGSPGVAPYTRADARFDLEESQFEVADQRPMEEILAEHLAEGVTIEGYEPAPAGLASPA